MTSISHFLGCLNFQTEIRIIAVTGTIALVYLTPMAIPAKIAANRHQEGLFVLRPCHNEYKVARLKKESARSVYAQDASSGSDGMLTRSSKTHQAVLSFQRVRDQFQRSKPVN